MSNPKYFKFFNEADCHNGFQYKDGLNVDTLEFNSDPNAYCCEGGLYFSDAKHICEFLGYGDYIREVEVPEGEIIVKDPEGNKFRSHSLFLHERKDLREVETWKYLIEQGVDIHADNDSALSLASGVSSSSTKTMQI